MNIKARIAATLASRAAAAAVLSLGIIAVIAPAAAHAKTMPYDRSETPRAITSCRTDYILAGSYVIRNNYWSKSALCIRTDGHAGFVVTKDVSAAWTIAYPSILSGCSWGICSPHSFLPARVSSLRNPTTSLSVTAHAAGEWNAAYDIWFGKRPIRTGQADGAG